MLGKLTRIQFSIFSSLLLNKHIRAEIIKAVIPPVFLCVGVKLGVSNSICVPVINNIPSQYIIKAVISLVQLVRGLHRLRDFEPQA
jgi:hypothetical protein